ncbi:MAG: hypothetical protein WAN65_08265 [Candidatus Sulfotelmatobacter sp.]
MLDFSLPALSPDLSLQMAIVNNLFWVDGPDGAQRTQYGAIAPPLQSYDYFAPVNECQGYSIALWPNLCVIQIQGCNLPGQGARYEASWRYGTDMPQYGGLNSGLYGMEQIINAQLLSRNAYSRQRVIIVGHSLGGALAECLAYFALAQTGLLALSVITYGSPRPGWQAFCNTLSGVDICRWMNDDDPVPCVPPRQNQAGLYFATLNNPGRLAANAYVQTRGGLELFTDGSAAAADTPGPASISLQTNLAAWLISVIQNVATHHSMPEYINRLQARQTSSLVAVPAPPGSTHSGTPVRQSQHLMQQIASEALATLRANTVAGNIDPVVIPDGKAFTYAKEGGVWVTLLRGSLFSIGPTRRAASGLAARGNRFLDRLQSEGQVNTEALELALSDYLADATDPNQGFRPVMRT